MVDLLISGRVYLCEVIGVIYSTSNGTYRSWKVSRPCSLLGCGEFRHYINREWKLTLSDDVLLALVLREDYIQTTKSLACDQEHDPTHRYSVSSGPWCFGWQQNTNLTHIFPFFCSITSLSALKSIKLGVPLRSPSRL